LYPDLKVKQENNKRSESVVESRSRRRRMRKKRRTSDAIKFVFRKLSANNYSCQS